MANIRFFHNKENPFVQLNKKSLWDKELSLEAVGLWSRLLSRPDDWEISITELCKSCDSAKPRIYRLLKELIDNGYAFRLQTKDERNHFNKTSYYIFETKTSLEEIQKMFPQHGFPLRGESCSGNRAPTNTDLNQKLEETYNSLVPNPTDSMTSKKNTLESPVQKKPSSQEAKEMANYLLRKVKSVHPALKMPNLDKWSESMDKLHLRDCRSWEEVKSLIDWAFEDSFWVSTIQSPEGLRRNWDKIAVKMKPITNRGTIYKANQDDARGIQAYLNKEGKGKTVQILSDSIYCVVHKEWISFSVSRETFKDLVFKYLAIRIDDEQV